MGEFPPANIRMKGNIILNKWQHLHSVSGLEFITNIHACCFIPIIKLSIHKPVRSHTFPLHAPSGSPGFLLSLLFCMPALELRCNRQITTRDRCFYSSHQSLQFATSLQGKLSHSLPLPQQQPGRSCCLKHLSILMLRAREK